ncbi:MAG: AraC family transcriptional regulator [Cyanobacteria bacterium J06626_18]
MTTLNLALSAGSLPAMLAESQRQVGARYQVEADEITWTLQQPFGRWHSRSVQVREGLDLVFTRANLQERVTFVESIENFSTWGIRFCLSGYSRIYPHNSGAEILIRPGTNLIGFMAGKMQATTDYAANQSVEMLTIGIKPELFKTLVPSVAKDFDFGQNIAIRTAISESLATLHLTTPEMLTILHKIINCPYQSDLRRLYLESKLLELIVLKLAQVQQEDPCPETGIRLKAEDVEQIHRARDILLQNLEHPPSLTELARLVEINDFKLKRGFRQVFGTTVFGYLHQYRMEKAQRLLESGIDSVAQVAQAVGYASPSQFSAAFKRKFGLSPKTYKSL